MSAAPPTRSRTQDSLAGCLVRLTWMAGASVLIFLFAVLTAEGRSVFGVPASVALWLAGAFAVAVRFWDIRFFGGQTVEGEPATLAHWRRYALTVAAVTAAAWVAALLLARTGFFR